jgi:hypothetical protein
LRAAAVIATALLAGCPSTWRNASPPEWSARELPDRPGVLEIEADRDHDGSFAKVLTPDGRTEVVQCESLPCRAVVPPGRYQLVVGTGGIGWLEAYGATLDVEVAACVTERLRVALAFKLLPGQGRVVRHDRVWLAADPHRWAKLPAGCSATTEEPPPVANAAAPR